MSMATTGTIWTRRTIHVYTDGNPGSTRNQLSYWPLAFEVRPHFQHVLKIQHRCAGRVKPCRFERIERAALSSHLRVERVCFSGSAILGSGPDIDIGDTFLHRLQSKRDFPYCVVQGWNRELRSKAKGKRHQNRLRTQMHSSGLMDLKDSRVGR